MLLGVEIRRGRADDKIPDVYWAFAMLEADDVIEPRDTNVRHRAKRPSDPLEVWSCISEHCKMVWGSGEPCNIRMKRT
jgi:hypothetical protein